MCTVSPSTRNTFVTGDWAGCAVDALEVDPGHEVVLGGDLPGEAVVGLEANDGAGLDLEHRLQVRAERPDDLVSPDDVVGRDCHRSGPVCRRRRGRGWQL